MDHELRVIDDAAGVAKTAADFVSRQAREALALKGSFTMAVSGGRSPWAMFAHLADEDVAWESVSIWQVDERIAPAGDPDRNAVGLFDAVRGLPITVHPMPVDALLDTGPLGAGDGATTDEQLIAAVCANYAESLPERFDLIHLGLGCDGHTASLVPNDDVLHVTDAAVAVTSNAYQGRRRMTLTYPALGRCEQVLWLVTGADKAAPLSALLTGDAAIPASHVRAPRSLVVADRAARGMPTTSKDS